MTKRNKSTQGFYLPANPTSSHFGKYPRSLQEAFRGVDYGAAIEVPCKGESLLKAFLGALPKVIWGVCLLGIASIVFNAI